MDEDHSTLTGAAEAALGTLRIEAVEELLADEHGDDAEELLLMESTYSNYAATDALRLAVDLHGQKYRDERPTDEKVLGTAEAFYQWLKSKEEQR